MNLHEQYYNLREACWKGLEEIVHSGCKIIGEFPISVGEISVPPKGLRTITTLFDDTYDMVIHGIIADPSYSIFPPKQSEKDINVTTNKIKVITKSYFPDKEEIVEVEPNILDLQTLSTYLSGGFSLIK